MTPKKGWKPLFLEKLREHANISRAAKDAGISRKTVYKERDNSTTFANEWDDALEEGIDYLEEEARRRAFEGVDEPLMFQGIKVGTVRKYSDTLMIFLLKGRRPDVYGDKLKHQGDPNAPLTVRVVYDD